MDAHDLTERSPEKESWDNPGPRILKFLDERERLVEEQLRQGFGKPYQQVFDELRAEFGEE